MVFAPYEYTTRNALAEAFGEIRPGRGSSFRAPLGPMQGRGPHIARRDTCPSLPTAIDGRRHLKSTTKLRKAGRAFWELGYVRLEFIFTIIWDGVVLLVAIVVRAGLLWVLGEMPEPVTQDWGIRILSLLSDLFLVAGAGVFAIFDLGKRIIHLGRTFIAAFSDPTPSHLK